MACYSNLYLADGANGLPLDYLQDSHIEKIETIGKSIEVQVYDTNYVKLPVDKPSFASLLYFFVIPFLAHILRCHHAVALSFLLCDIAPQKSHIPTIVSDGTEFSINFFSPLPPSEVRKVYSTARNTLIGKKRRIAGKWARPRGLSTKVARLLGFVKENSRLTWKQRFNKWRMYYPYFTFRNIHTMQATYYRAKKIERYWHSKKYGDNGTVHMPTYPLTRKTIDEEE